jgi:hypothetical protein
LYKAALIVKRQSDAAIKNSKLKLKHRQQHLQKQLKEQLKRKLRMRKDLLQKRERKQLQQSSRSRKAKKQGSTQPPENRPQRTHDDLMKDMERLKNALGIDSSIIEQQYFTMKLIKYKTLCGNLSTQEGRWTITTLI